jgi:hypothetical protein
MRRGFVHQRVEDLEWTEEVAVGPTATGTEDRHGPLRDRRPVDGVGRVM